MSDLTGGWRNSRWALIVCGDTGLGYVYDYLQKHRITDNMPLTDARKVHREMIETGHAERREGDAK